LIKSNFPDKTSPHQKKFEKKKTPSYKARHKCIYIQLHVPTQEEESVNHQPATAQQFSEGTKEVLTFSWT
jgi:hypothetical protein